MWEKAHSHGDPFGSTEDERRGETYFEHLVDPSLTQFYEPAGGYSTKTQRDAQPNATTIWLEYKDSSIVNSVSFNRALEKISHAPFSTLYWNAEKQLTSFHPPCEGKRTKLRWLKDSSPSSFEQILSSPPTGSAGPPDSILVSSSPNTERDVATALPVLPAKTWRVHNGYISKIMESSMNDSVLTSLDGLSSIKAILADGEWRPHEVLTIDEKQRDKLVQHARVFGILDVDRTQGKLEMIAFDTENMIHEMKMAKMSGGMDVVPTQMRNVMSSLFSDLGKCVWGLR
jgi:hypothetical protein